MGMQKKFVSLALAKETSSPMAQTKKTPPEEEIEALKKRLKELEGCLPYAELQNLALNTMIDIAEEQGIQIRKKRGPNSNPTLRAERPERQDRLQTVWPLQTGLLPTKVGR